MEDCIFCKIVKGEIPAKFVFKGEHIVAFLSIEPLATTHILIIPKQHIPTFMDLGNDEIMKEMTNIAHKLIDENKLQNGYKMILNGGIYQRVKHIHWHLLGGDNLESEVGN